MAKTRKSHQKVSDDPFRPRKCRLCKLVFRPTTKHRYNADQQEFCCDNHRKEFWKHGGLPLEKLMLRIDAAVRKIVREEFARCVANQKIEALRDEIRNQDAA